MSELFEELDSTDNGSTVSSASDTEQSGKGRGKTARAGGSSSRRGGNGETLSSASSSEPGGAAPLMAAPTSPDVYAVPTLPDRIQEARTGAAVPSMFAGEGLTVERVFTREGEDVFDTTEWDYRTAAITDERGAVVFEQKDCEIPRAWSMLATNVVVSKYFRGKVGTPERETSVRQIVSRVADTIHKWGKQGGYFATDADATAFHDELKYLLLHQYMAFNSPVWFNLGVPRERPQVSACFINSVDDTMESILTLAKTEGMLFKWGSGTGTNFSVLRSSREGLKGGGTASGPVSFMRGFDAFAGAIKSGGKCFKQGTRVATPEGWVPIESLKVGEPVLTHRGARPVADFMPNGVKQCFLVRTVEGYELEVTAGHKFAFWNEDTCTFDVKPIEAFVPGEPLYVLTEASEGGRSIRLTTPPVLDGGMRFPSELNDQLAYVLGLMYGDGKRTEDEAGQQSAERFRTYCQELFGEAPLLLGDASKPWMDFLTTNKLATAKADNPGFPPVLFEAVPEIRAAFIAGVLDAEGTYQQSEGWSLPSRDRGFLVEFQRLLLTLGVPAKLCLTRPAEGEGQALYRLNIVGHTFIERLVERIKPYSARAQVNYLPSPGADKGWGYRRSRLPALAARGGTVAAYAAELSRCVQVTLQSVTPTEMAETYDIEVEEVHLLCANGLYASNTRRAAKMVILNADHPDIEDFVECKADAEKKAHALIEAGYSGMFNVPNGAYDSVFFQNANHSVRATDDFMRAVELDRDWMTAEVTTGNPSKTYRARDLMHKISEAAWVCGDPGMQFDTTINRWHTCPNTARINASNPCSEYMFLDDSACNLASLNLMRFRKANREFDVELFKHAVRVTITAMEIMVSNAAYPTDKITINSYDYRPLGLGYANLGALLMASGVPYDSDEGRAYAAGITAIMSGEAYHQSARMARRVGPFAGYERNRQPFLRVMTMHRDHVEAIHGKEELPEEMLEAARKSWDDAILEGEAHGYRNSQISVLAPTGTIGFLMDCDTTGVEPDIAIVKYKTLVGGGMFKIVNQTVPEALERLGYSASERKAILEHIEQQDTIEGAPGLQEEHLPIFDCAFRPKNGKRSIQYMGHIRMMAAVQPFLSGAISKCVTGNTLIFTDRGIVPIGQFYAGEKPGEFTPLNRTLGSIAEPQKADLFYYGGIRPTVRLTLADGRTIEGTPNHRVKVASASGYDWKRLDQITADDYVAVRLGADVWSEEDADLSGFGGQKTVPLPGRINPVLGRWLGWYIARGSACRSNGTVQITSNDRGILERCAEIVRQEFGLEGRIGTDAQNGVTHFVVSSRTLVEWLEFVGAGGNSAGKRIPWAVLQSTRDTMREFVGGLWLDGSIRPDGMTASYRNAPELLAQLQVVLNNFGLHPRIIHKFNRTRNRHFAELGLFGADVRRFAEWFALDEPHKAERLTTAVARAKQVDAVYSDVLPCFRDLMEAAVRQAGDTERWRQVLDRRTPHLSWQTACDLYAEYGIAQLGEIVENNIHFVRVRTIAEGMAEVYDFQVPTNHAFLGNAIVNHNTVNMPHDATPADIAEAYMQAWKLGVKALAIYRDGSKKTQPLSTGKSEDTKKPVYQPMRRKLPDERQSLTHKFSVGGHEGYLTVGLYPDGTPGEIFIMMSKEGSVVSGLMDSFATSISLALQYGVPLRTLVEKFMHTRFEPSGFTGNPEIPMAKSIMDYLFRYLALKFLDRDERSHVGLLADQTDEYDNGVEAVSEQKPARGGQSGPVGSPAGNTGNPAQAAERQVFVTQADAPPCPDCGGITTRNGACYRCANCGTSIGCS